ncbi:ABC transporter permease, partial [Streptomyces sp. NPDC127110]|uniref:ABC transporter permease n=1 Tax=Streptomyces sp. NPDC127110 TaxID=3345362 RepID=UPI00363DE2DE
GERVEVEGNPDIAEFAPFVADITTEDLRGRCRRLVDTPPRGRARAPPPDRLLMRAVDALSAIPHLLLGIFIVALFRPGTWPVVVSVALTHWLSTARIVRAEVLSLRGRPYVDAAVSGGASRWRVTVRHLVPGVLPQAGLAAVLMIPHAMWHESALSFLGLGLPAHQASLGTLVQAGRGSLLAGDWWPTLFPGLLLIVPTLAIAGLAGAWRDRLSPRRRSELNL